MYLCDLSLDSPEENLACDEALLELSEQSGAGEILRLWAPSQYFIVVGYANKIASEVNLNFCRHHGIPVLRRCSGGGTVLQGPGCLNYALVLRIDEVASRQGIHGTNREVLQKHIAALASLLSFPVRQQGHTDLAFGTLKFSGNSQRRKQKYLLYHGSFLLDLDLGLVERALPMPSHQPEYRANRRHSDFLMNIPVPLHDLKRALVQAWNAHTPLTPMPFDRIASLVQEKYGSPAWNAKF